jgi:hypothetical protein
MSKKPFSESLPELISRKRTENIIAILSMIDAEQQGIVTLPEDYKTGENALVYDLGLVAIELLKMTEGTRAKKWKELQVLNRKIIPMVLPEIEELYAAIKKVGLKPYLVEGEDKAPERWREAVLTRHDDSKKGFQTIDREDLEAPDLYQFRPGKEKEDFTLRLLQKVLARVGFNTYGMGLLKTVVKQKPT